MHAMQSSCDIPLSAVLHSALVRASSIGDCSSAIAEREALGALSSGAMETGERAKQQGFTGFVVLGA